MAGIKNIYQIYNVAPPTIKGKTILDRHFQTQYTPLEMYCRYCGGVILESDKDSNNNSVDYETERYFAAHTNCLRKNTRV